MKVSAYAAKKEKSSLEPFIYEAAELHPDEVELNISHCGICHSDLHLIDNDWQSSIYPLVPGHEIVGTINAMGSAVKGLELGQRVGIGWQCNSCLACEWCLQGEENLCAHSQAVAVGHYGGFANQVRSHYRFVIPIPDALDSASAAPLLCGGITVYSPLRNYNVRPFMRVGVIGIGGLGHLALQFAHAFGCEVTAFSTTPEKEQEAKQFGAHHFINTKDEAQLKKYAGKFDFILSTVNVDLNWELYLSLLRPHGKLCFVGAANSVQVSIFSLIAKEKIICGSVIGSPRVIREMLEVAARHKIGALTQVMPMNKVNEALDLVRHNQARYRMVLEYNARQ